MTATADPTPTAPAAEAKRRVSFLVDGARLTIRRVDEFGGYVPTGIAVSWTAGDREAFAAESTEHGTAVHRGPK